MPWVRIDEEFYHHPKLVQAGPLGMALQVAALCYCNKHLTDGFIPTNAARSLLSWEHVDDERRVWTLAETSGHAGHDVESDHIIGRLLEVGVWEETRGGYRIHDYDQYQPTREKVIAEREATKARVERFRSVRNGSGNGATHGVGNAAPGSEPGSEPKTKPKSKSSTRARRAEHEHPEFEKFWQAYPRRIYRADAARAFTTLVEREHVDPQVLAAAAGNYADLVRRRGDAPKFVKHAETFLRNKRWAEYAHGIPEDELRTAANGLSANQQNVENVMRMVRGGDDGPRELGAGDWPADRVLPAHDAP